MRMNAFNTQEECRHKKSRRELEAKPVCVPHENPTRTGRQTRADGSDEDWLADDEDLKDCAGQMELGGRGGGGPHWRPSLENCSMAIGSLDASGRRILGPGGSERDYLHVLFPRKFSHNVLHA